MSQRRVCESWKRLSVCALLIVTAPSALADDPQKKLQTKADSFSLSSVWSLHLEISAKEFAAIQPAALAGPGPAGRPPKRKVPAGRESERNLFGMTFPWGKGRLSAAGRAFKNIHIRYAGNITYFVSARGLKRPFKVRLGDKQQFHGLNSFHLHSMPLDPAKTRERLAFSVFRAAGVPAPRTAFAEVTLTVPGKYDKEYLGLFTLVEDVGPPFLAAQFKTSKGLLMKPFRLRGIAFLGEDFARYTGRYRPQRKATDNEAKRVIEFARLVNEATDEEFTRRIGSFLDVDAFLRFMAANVLTSNVESFFALGQNYHLYLDPRTNKFTFIPNELEFSLANYLLMGSGEELMNLRLTKPYPGENKLPDRLLAIDDVSERYHRLLSKLSATVFTKDRLLKDIAAIDKATRAIREREAKAARARRDPRPGFGGGPQPPQPPNLKTFAVRRTASVADQLSGKTEGYVPRPFQFGPRRNRSATPISEATFRENVKVPSGFAATLFAAPPKVGYLVAIACEPSGAVYVAVDEQGSLGRSPGGGRILRCVDTDDDGKVDDVTIYAKVDHPRGVTYRDGKVWVMHPPTLSVFEDKDGDGVADRKTVLVTGLTTDQIAKRGGDHTTNCVRMGIDGWLYIGVGDYGIKRARGKDGRTIVQRGGGIVRVRPDGTELEVYCTGLRNPFDLAIDPFLNLFTRDNTNDGAGWDTRVSLLKQSAQYGYTQLFANFTDEIMPTLGTFGNSGGTGGLFLQDSRWPAGYNNTLFTSDWGSSEVYRHKLVRNGPTFDLEQDVFASVPRATGMDVDALGRLYVGSWYGGSAVGFEGPNIGFVARITPKDLVSTPPPNFKRLSASELIKLLASPLSVIRHHAQGEILARGRNAKMSSALVALAKNDRALLEGRIAAIFTLKQLGGKESQADLRELADIPAIREFALRALTDRTSEVRGLDPSPFVNALKDPSPRVRAQALISLGRLNDPATAKSVLPFTARKSGSKMPTRKPLQNQPDPGRVVPHLAVRSLVALNAVDVCLKALDGPHRRGALMALRYMHDTKTVDGLIKRLRTARDAELRRGILVTLIRLYHREADYDGSWWGIRPDNTGPYYDPAKWEMSKRIGNVVTAAVLDSDPQDAAFLKAQLARHQVSLAGVPLKADVAAKDEQKPIVIAKADPNNPRQIGNLSYEVVVRQALSAKGDAQNGERLFRSQSCIACHTTADGQRPKGPHLVDIGKRSKPNELVESILKPSAKLAQGYETYQFTTVKGRAFTGFVVGNRANTIIIREGNGVRRELKRDYIELQAQQKVSAMPESLVANLTPDQLADLLAYLQSLNSLNLGQQSRPPRVNSPGLTTKKRVVFTVQQHYALPGSRLSATGFRKEVTPIGSTTRAASWRPGSI